MSMFSALLRSKGQHDPDLLVGIYFHELIILLLYKEEQHALKRSRHGILRGRNPLIPVVFESKKVSLSNHCLQNYLEIMLLSRGHHYPDLLSTYFHILKELQFLLRINRLKNVYYGKAAANQWFS